MPSQVWRLSVDPRRVFLVEDDEVVVSAFRAVFIGGAIKITFSALYEELERTLPVCVVIVDSEIIEEDGFPQDCLGWCIDHGFSWMHHAKFVVYSQERYRVRLPIVRSYLKSSIPALGADQLKELCLGLLHVENWRLAL